MGFCCSKDAMPVMNDTGRQQKDKPATPTPELPAVDFDVIVPEGAQPLTMSFVPNGNSTAGLFNMSVCTVSDADSQGDPHGQSLSGTLRGGMNDTYSATMVTNVLQEVTASHIEQFVNNILEKSVTEPRNMLEESFCSAKRMRTSITSLGSSNSISREQLQYLNSATSCHQRVSRLEEVEALARQEIFGAWQMNTVLIAMARKRIMPTIRQRRVTKRSEQAKKKENVLVIHAKDIDVQFDEMAQQKDATPKRETSQSSGVLFSPQEVKEEVEKTEKKEETVEHYQLLALTAREISITANVKAEVVNDTWDFLSLPNAASHLGAGNAYFRFVCSPVPALSKDSLDLIDTFINYTSFTDEVRENNTPKINIYSEETQQGLVSILVKAMYLLPGVRLAHVTPELLASLDYQRNCQPGDNKFEEPDTPYTFRTVKTVIKFVFSITIQMKVSEITDPEALQSFKNVDGIVPARVLMLERTKKNIQKTDSTVKVRSILLYYPVNDGFLVNNQTIVLNSSVPRVVSKLLQTFGSQGAAEAAQTAVLTRRYMIHRFGDSRS